jgi:hypothetical protein
MEILFWRHCTTAQKRKGMCTIYTRVTIFGRRAELGSTGIKTFADHWDQERQEVTALDPHGMFKNEQLTDCKAQILAIQNEFIRKRKTITADRIKDEYLRSGAQYTYLGAFAMFLAEYKSDTEHEESSFKTIRDTGVRMPFGGMRLAAQTVPLFLEALLLVRSERRLVVYMPQYVRRYYAIGLHSTRARLTGV